jgi:hypothetical protein
MQSIKLLPITSPRTYKLHNFSEVIRDYVHFTPDNFFSQVCIPGFMLIIFVRVMTGQLQELFLADVSSSLSEPFNNLSSVSTCST